MCSQRNEPVTPRRDCHVAPPLPVQLSWVWGENVLLRTSLRITGTDCASRYSSAHFPCVSCNPPLRPPRRTLCCCCRQLTHQKFRCYGLNVPPNFTLQCSPNLRGIRRWAIKTRFDQEGKTLVDEQMHWLIGCGRPGFVLRMTSLKLSCSLQPWDAPCHSWPSRRLSPDA